MRNDYVGYGILKDTIKYKNRLIEMLITQDMNIEQKTMIKIKVNNMSYKEVVQALKTLEAK